MLLVFKQERQTMWKQKINKKAENGEERFSYMFFVPRRLPFLYGERDTFIRLASR